MLLVGFLFAASFKTPLQDENRHVQSRITSLVHYGEAPDPVWVYLVSLRDIWIRPDGSGRISEQLLDRTFPTPDEESQWVALGQPDYGGVNESFAVGELYYYRASDVRDTVADPFLRFEPAGDSLRRLGSHLAETNPSDQVLHAALDVAQSLGGADVRRTEDRIEIAGQTGDGKLTVTLVFGLAPVRFLEERWETDEAVRGIARTPPFLIYGRVVLISEAVPGF